MTGILAVVALISQVAQMRAEQHTADQIKESVDELGEKLRTELESASKDLVAGIHEYIDEQYVPRPRCDLIREEISRRLDRLER